MLAFKGKEKGPHVGEQAQSGGKLSSISSDYLSKDCNSKSIFLSEFMDPTNSFHDPNT